MRLTFGIAILQRAAMTQSALSKERRELREQQQRTALEAIPKDLSRPWEDPLPEPGERHLAQVSFVMIGHTRHAAIMLLWGMSSARIRSL